MVRDTIPSWMEKYVWHMTMGACDKVSELDSMVESCFRVTQPGMIANINAKIELLNSLRVKGELK